MSESGTLRSQPWLGHSMTITVGALWRYPVKSLAGEPLTEATLTSAGIPGDRVVHVRGPAGVRTSRSRRHFRMLGLHGTTGHDGEPLIDGHQWTAAEALALVRDAAGPDAELARSDDRMRFDGMLALNADVTTPGIVRAGDPVRLVSP